MPHFAVAFADHTSSPPASKREAPDGGSPRKESFLFWAVVSQGIVYKLLTNLSAEAGKKDAENPVLCNLKVQVSTKINQCEVYVQRD